MFWLLTLKPFFQRKNKNLCMRIRLLYGYHIYTASSYSFLGRTVLLSVTKRSQLYSYQNSSVMHVTQTFHLRIWEKPDTEVDNDSSFKIYFICNHLIDFYIPHKL